MMNESRRRKPPPAGFAETFIRWGWRGVETGPGKWEQPTPLYSSWCAFAAEAGDDAGSQKSFTDRLRKRDYPSKRTGPKGRFYDGSALRMTRHSDGSDA